MKNKIAFYPTPKEIVNIMINLNKNFDSILDTGFGQGVFIEKLIEKSVYKNVFGIELDENFYNIIYEKYKDDNKVSLINEDFLNFNFKNQFKTIIGNPPYITNDNLPLSIKNKIKELTGSGEGNIYYAFIMKSIELLEDNGELIYILPYDFFYNTYAENLRKTFIENGEFELIIDLGDLNIFKNASPETIIFKWIKRKNKLNNKIKIYKYIKKDVISIIYKNLENILNNNIDNNNFVYFEILGFTINDKIWSLSNFKEYKNTIELSKIADVGVGIVNGAEDIFKLNKEKINNFSIEEKNQLIKKFIKSKNLNNYIIENMDDNDYIFINDKIIKTEEDLKKYSNIYEYLLNFKEQLSDRYIAKIKNWYNYLAIRNLNLMEKHINSYKIIVPNITRKNEKWFSITNSPYYISGDVLMLTGKTEKDTFLLFGILNSEYFNVYYKEKGAKKGTRKIFNQKILKEINIPNFSEEIENTIINEVKNMIHNNIFNFNIINNIINHEIKHQ